MEIHVGWNWQSESKNAYLCSCWSGEIVMATEEASGGKSCCWDFIHSGEGFLNETWLLRDNWFFLLPLLISWLAMDKYEHTLLLLCLFKVSYLPPSSLSVLLWRAVICWNCVKARSLCGSTCLWLLLKHWWEWESREPQLSILLICLCWSKNVLLSETA